MIWLKPIISLNFYLLSLLSMSAISDQQVLINMMVNAIHAMPDGGRLRLATGDDDGGVRIEVADTGGGMDPDVASRIFDPFFTTKLGEGSGLGLSISQTLVTRYGGSIAVADTSPEGTRFEIWLPSAA